MLKKRIRCPHCHRQLDKEPKRITECPHCELPIYTRYDVLCTEYEAKTYYDWRDRGLVIFNLVKH